MKNIKTFLKIILAVMIINCLPQYINGQNFETTEDSFSDQISKEDFNAILEVLDIELYKFNVKFSNDQKCIVRLYKQEYEKRNLIKEESIWGTPSPFRKVENGKELYTPLEFIRLISKKNDKDFTLNIKMGDFGIRGYPIHIDSIYTKPHACKPFKLPDEYAIGNKIPLLLIGSFWDSTSRDGTMKIQRFCWELKELNSDFSNKAFDEMPHYFIIGIRIDEPE